ncbi:MAG: hydrogenase formation protein HypD [Chloroflexota bacterium]
MKFVDEFRDPELAKRLIDHICSRSTRPIRLMEFCGTHTVAIFKHGIRQLLPETIEMLSGPGCPICVTANTDLDRAIALARLPGVIVTSFGDMLRVPGSHSSLQVAKAEDGDVRIVYSVADALAIARENPDKSVVFIGIGFETTAPIIAASVVQAEQEGIQNYYVLSLAKVCPPIMKAVLDSGEIKIDGILCPGHVSAIIGARPYGFIPRDYGVACVVSGFEPLDILHGVSRLVEQVESGQPKVEIAYRRVVSLDGNERALAMMSEVFEPGPANWRGIGTVPGSGLRLRDRYRRFDAEAFSIDAGEPFEPPGCLCGDILRGVKTPPDCKLFGVTCTTEHPVGPCMVSSEGTCSAYYRYGGEIG